MFNNLPNGAGLRETREPEREKYGKFLCFGGAAKGTSEQFTNDSETVGRMLAARGHRLTYGGGRTGLMGAVSAGALGAGGQVHGIIPYFLEFA